MGGPGSGNHWHDGAKSTTDAYRRIDVRLLAREGVLRPGYLGRVSWTRHGETVASVVVQAEQDSVALTYRHRRGDDDWKDEQYSVRIVRSPCHLGGSRPWFICPAVGCGRRVAILYGDGLFACRHCHRLAYASSREDPSGRTMRRADRLRERLGWRPGVMAPGGQVLRRLEEGSRSMNDRAAHLSSRILKVIQGADRERDSNPGHHPGLLACGSS